jgi:hypothetical protein
MPREKAPARVVGLWMEVSSVVSEETVQREMRREEYRQNQCEQ